MYASVLRGQLHETKKFTAKQQEEFQRGIRKGNSAGCRVLVV